MNHLIQSQQIELSLQGDEKAAFGLQERMSRFFKAEMLPEMVRILDQSVGENESWHIDRIELDLGVLNEDELFSALSLDRLAERLASALQAKESFKRQTQTGSPQAQAQIWQIWTHFLIKGTLPWYVKQLPEATEKTILALLQANPQDRQNLTKILQRHPQALLRLCLQMKPEFVVATLKTYEPNLSNKALQLSALIEAAIQNQASSIATPSSQAKLLAQINNLFWQFQAEQILTFSDKSIQKVWEQRTLDWLLQFVPNLPLKTWREFAKIIPQAKAVASQKATEAEVSPDKTAEEDTLTLQMPKAKEEKDSNQAFGEAAPIDSSQAPKAEETKQRAKKENALENEAKSPDAKSVEAEKQKTKEETEQNLNKTKAEIDTIKSENAEAKMGPSPDLESAQASSEGEELLGETSAKLLDPPAQKADSVLVLHDQDHFLNHVGVILCHAYLKMFWQNIGWVENGAFIDLRAQEQAVLSLHYLATGERQAPEYKLILPKILCGLPLNHPLDVRQELSLEDAEEADNLLAAIIQNWGALGEVSNDSLREGFLQRAGKLSLKNGKWRLQIERQTLDILLDRLPWSIGIVKMPWMPDPIMVDWN